MSQKTNDKIKDELNNQSNEIVKADTPAAILKRTLEEQAEAFEVLLPKGLERDKFELQLATAVKATPALLKCLGTPQGRISLILAARQAASAGLELNTLRHEASLVPQKNKDIDECRLDVEWRGYVKLAEEASGGKVDAQIVREGDEFHYGYSLQGDVLDHTPSSDEDSPKVYAWARIRYPDGRAQFIVMSRAAIEKRRAMSASWSNPKKRPYSPWTKWEDEQWKKTAVRQLCKSIPLSSKTALAIASDEAPLLLDTSGPEPEVVPSFDDEPIEAEIVPENNEETHEEADPGRPFA